MYAIRSYYAHRACDVVLMLSAAGLGVFAGANLTEAAVLQQAINKVFETTGQGIVLLAPGRYRLTDTVYIWP